MTYPIHPGLSFRAAQTGEICQTLSFAELLRSVQTSYCLLFNSSSSITPLWGKLSNLWRLFLLDQGFPVDYELDKFNMPHTGTTLRHPQNWLCWLQCKILLRHLATSSLGNIFWRHSRFSPKQPEPQTHCDFNVSLLKQQTRLLLHYGKHISLAHPTMP